MEVNCPVHGQPQMPPLQIKVKRLTPTAILPTKAYAHDIGWDLYADASTSLIWAGPDWYVPPGHVLVISTGIAVEFPYGWGAYIRPRSSQGIKNIDIYGGVIDNGYRGELKVSVHNSSHLGVRYNPGDRVGQLVLTASPESVIIEVDELTQTELQHNGHGSSGR